MSFWNLVEAFVLAAMRRQHGVSLQRVRKALRYVERELDVRRPLIDVRFKTDGADLFVEKFGALVNASRGGQIAIRSALESRLARIDWDEGGLAERVFPLVRTGDGSQPKAVVIDPRRGFGRPVVVGTGVAAAVIAERYQAGESVAALAADYGILAELVEDALRSEFRAAA